MDPNSTDFFIRQELAANRKAIRNVLAALTKIAEEYPQTYASLKLEKLCDKIHEDLCWND